MYSNSDIFGPMNPASELLDQNNATVRVIRLMKTELRELCH